MTQDQFGHKYDISGPAVFKFEKGYVKPSLDLWLKMSADFKIPEKTAVLMWLKTRLPEKYQNLIQIKNPQAEAEIPEAVRPSPRAVDYTKFEDRKEMRKVANNDRKLPKGLREFLKDDEIWVIYKPTGAEINFLRDAFGKLGQGSIDAFREALRAMRSFKTEK
ncbi:MAG: hypothetical protein JW816_02695 [Candidatus Buchananbacteria bacterium]|nr:hypothetical protein [Candidatus Buchananbacteria bacterium]